jgi:response regulator RpfG family c-di-GMP phosphodiesterase
VSQRILLVDDEARVLDALRRNLHGRYDVETATSGAAGLTRVAEAAAPYAVVVSDMMMPGMDGSEFLAKVHEISPDTVQMILSGQAELSSTISAVNNGNLFRFLTKPCTSDDLARAVDAALGQYRLIQSERELLERTLDGAVEVLTEVMSAAAPTAYKRTETVKTLVGAVTKAMPVAKSWELRIAAMLGQVGLMAIPEEIISQVKSGESVTDESMAMYRSYPTLSHDLISRIPRLERVADWVGAQPVSIDDAVIAPQPATDADDDGITGREVYAAVMAFVVGLEAGLTPGATIHRLATAGRFGQPLLDTILHAHTHTSVRSPRKVNGEELMVGMQINQDVVTKTGLTLVKSGEILTESMAIRLRHFATGVGLVEPINVLV